MDLEKIQDPVSSVRFHNCHKELVDLDFLFREANKFYARRMLDQNITPDFDFTKQYNKKLYTNELVRIICDWIKTRECSYTLYFYWGIKNDTFRDSLVKKLSKTFGFRILDKPYTFDEYIGKIEQEFSTFLFELEIFLSKQSTLKFKNLKKHLEKTGMTYLKDSYFEELHNKMILFC